MQEDLMEQRMWKLAIRYSWNTHISGALGLLGKYHFFNRAIINKVVHEGAVRRFMQIWGNTIVSRIFGKYNGADHAILTSYRFDATAR